LGGNDKFFFASLSIADPTNPINEQTPRTEHFTTAPASFMMDIFTFLKLSPAMRIKYSHEFGALATHWLVTILNPS
jgi:hypothetical protein